MFRLHKFTPGASGWVAIKECKKLGFNFQPGFVLGKDNQGWFVFKGSNGYNGSEAEFYMYRLQRDGTWKEGMEWDTPACIIAVALADEMKFARLADRIGISAALAAALSR